MPAVKKDILDRFGQRNERHASRLALHHVPAGSPRRPEAEAFIREIFARRYDASVGGFAPNLVLFEEAERVVAATGWRAAGDAPLFLERYLDTPIEDAVSQLTAQPVARERIVEVGNLAAEKAGSSVHVILTLARHFDRLGFEWVVFTATHELVAIFTRLGLPLLALASADPARLGADAAQWGSYYDMRPVVVAGRIRLGIERVRQRA